MASAESRRVEVTQTAKSGLLAYAIDVGPTGLGAIRSRLLSLHLEDLPEVEVDTGKYRVLTVSGHRLYLRAMTDAELARHAPSADSGVLVMAVVRDGNDE